MDIEIYLDEPGEMRCSDLDLPMITPGDLTDELEPYLNYIKQEQWELLARGNVDYDTALLLSDQCHNIVEKVCDLVLEVVDPQVRSWTKCRFEPPQDRNYHTVTEEDIEASLGDSLLQYFEGELGVVVEKSDNSKHLLQLVSEEVAKEVNRKLEKITHPNASRQPEELCQSPNKYMVYHIVKILEKYLAENFEIESTDEGCTGSISSEASSPNEETMEEEFGTEERQCSKQRIVLTPLSHKEEFPQGENTCLSVSHDNTPDQIESPDQECLASELSQAPSPDEKIMVEEFSSDYNYELSQEEKTFLAVFLIKLLGHIAHSTKTSVLDLKFDGNFKNLKRILGVTSFTIPQTIGDLHLTTFKKLCQEFGSAKLLQAAAVSGGKGFEEAVASELKRQLQKATRKPLSFGDKVRGYFTRQSRKIAPACEVAPLEEGSTPLPQKKQKRPAITRMFSAVARILRKPFTCHCSGSQED